MKMTQEQFVSLAKDRGVSLPSEELMASKYADLHAMMQPLARKGVRTQARECVSTALQDARRGQEYLTFLQQNAQKAEADMASMFYSAALSEVESAITALAKAMKYIDDAKRADAEARDGYAETSAKVLKRPDPVFNQTE
ncbi:hypothetical protein [Rhizobium leguminosarum]|uniref:hypothetical protein n=1 Tax=Rhizobium leguminosarum TaxID=384 RepID=UPI0014417471|nr:hypothetical protein [Rhizobium leguminosarum]NKL60076.1 hypothetical protein [Rhizobium leguminosarum bv. viciae]